MRFPNACHAEHELSLRCNIGNNTGLYRAVHLKFPDFIVAAATPNRVGGGFFVPAFRLYIVRNMKHHFAFVPTSSRFDAQSVHPSGSARVGVVR